jgi:hypothetical protein
MRIAIDSKFWGSKKLHDTALALKANKDEVGAAILKLWCWTVENKPDGRFEGMTDSEVGAISGGRWGADFFVGALIGCGWIDSDERKVLSLHDWMDYQGSLIRERQRDAERKRKRRGAGEKTPAPVPAPARPEMLEYKPPVGGSEGPGILHKLCRDWNKSKGFPISPERGRKHIEASIAAGASPADIEQAFWNPKLTAGKKIWEVIEPLIPKSVKKSAWEENISALTSWAKGAGGQKSEPRTGT